MILVGVFQRSQVQTDLLAALRFRLVFHSHLHRSPFRVPLLALRSSVLASCFFAKTSTSNIGAGARMRDWSRNGVSKLASIDRAKLSIVGIFGTPYMGTSGLQLALLRTLRLGTTWLAWIGSSPSRCVSQSPLSSKSSLLRKFLRQF
jgi:hypothetical protein